MVNFSLDINQKIEVIKGDINFKSLITDVSENGIKINIPISGGEYLFVSKGEELEINTYAGDGKCFRFNTKVIDKIKEDNIPCYTLSEPYNVKKIQRRNFFRVDVYNNVQVKNISGLAESNYNEVKFIDTLMVDLSAGGARIITHERYKEKDLLLIRMNIKDSEFRLKADVIRSEEKDNNQNVYGIKFLDITQSQADKIIEQLFEIMRKRRASVD